MRLGDLIRERCYCELGVVQIPLVAPPAPPPGAVYPPPLGPTSARMVQVRTVPGGRVLEARVANLGQGLGKGVFAPLAIGDEVIVLFPNGDPMNAVVIGGLGSATAPNPIANTGLQALIQHPGGVQLGTLDGQPAHGIVHGQHLVDLSAYLTALDAYLTAVAVAVNAAATAGSVPVIVPASQTAWEAASESFRTAVATSAGSGTPPGVGGPPHATALHKVTP